MHDSNHKSARIARWETTLREYTRLDAAEWAQANRDAHIEFTQFDSEEDRQSAHDDTDWWFGNAVSDFKRDAKRYFLGSLTIDFLHAMHGTAGSISVYRLPGGTTILLRTTTALSHRSTTRIYRGHDYQEMLAMAYDLLFHPESSGEEHSESEQKDCGSLRKTRGAAEAVLRTNWRKWLEQEALD